MTHPAFRQFQLQEETRRLAASGRRTSLLPASRPGPATDAEVVLRLCTVHDDEALARLAGLEGRPLPAGRFVVALVDGTLVAAQPLAGGPPFADPFRRTTDVLHLMELRTRQLAPAGARRVALRRWSAARP
ncbi:MAG: hypothetical protein JO186_00350 [Actinobacteria bacterium]|nr:hypothetical protein [Actinomycetota bacterium]MBV8395324.1 hypothetical protein [Actinomycetota bacterium]